MTKIGIFQGELLNHSEESAKNEIKCHKYYGEFDTGKHMKTIFDFLLACCVVLLCISCHVVDEGDSKSTTRIRVVSPERIWAGSGRFNTEYFQLANTPDFLFYAPEKITVAKEFHGRAHRTVLLQTIFTTESASCGDLAPLWRIMPGFFGFAIGPFFGLLIGFVINNFINRVSLLKKRIPQFVIPLTGAFLLTIYLCSSVRFVYFDNANDSSYMLRLGNYTTIVKKFSYHEFLLPTGTNTIRITQENNEKNTEEINLDVRGTIFSDPSIFNIKKVNEYHIDSVTYGY